MTTELISLTVSVSFFEQLHVSKITIKPVLCDSSRKKWNNAKWDRKSLNSGSININIIALWYENNGHLIQEILIDWTKWLVTNFE